MNTHRREWLKLHWEVLDHVCDMRGLQPYLIYDSWEDINYKQSDPRLHSVKASMRLYATFTLRQQRNEQLRCALMGYPVWNHNKYNEYLKQKARLEQIHREYETRNIIN